MKLKKFVFGFTMVFTLLTVSISAIKPEDVSSSGLKVGGVMPETKSTTDGLAHLIPQKNSHRYTLVHFWAAYDAESRAENVRWNRFFTQHTNDRINFKGVSLDTEKSVYKLTLDLDKVDSSTQMLVAIKKQDEVKSTYGLANGFHSYLVDELGVVRAVDPTPDQLNQFYEN